MLITVPAPPPGHEWNIETAVDSLNNDGYDLELRVVIGGALVDSQFFEDRDEIIDAANELLSRFGTDEFHTAVVGDDITFEYVEDLADEQ